ncbi:MAG: UDP-N-acetylmuramate--L-alanine ligase [Candidatus Lambdaproteobacteria bacterium]|nr:UDP-N-acetylmuramate--L-alanine ligase [Candidatus Lambdaproteobacteria bacterium]
MAMDIPPNLSRVHLMGICGTAMAALAGTLQAQGLRVTGSDQHVYPPMSDHLAALGIRFAEGYRAENIPADAQLVVVGNVIQASNPEAQEAVRRGLPYISMAEAVRRFAIRDRYSIVIAGTHGKTTTTALMAHTLVELGADPGFLVGGIALNFSSNFRVGNGRCFVIEGDEYDTAYFDKRPKFFHYAPTALIFTSLEFDHADIYPDLAAIRRQFERLVAGLPREGLLVACADDAQVMDVAAGAPCPVVSYGHAGQAACRIEGWRATAEGCAFETVHRGEGEGGGDRLAWRLPLPGRHNAQNAAAVIALARQLGHPPPAIQGAFSSFRGVKRRQEVRGEAAGVLVIDDFAHHPTAIRVTIEAIRARYPGRRLWAVFEPRSFTARSDRFQGEFGAAFAGADRVVLANPFRSDYSAGKARPLDSGAVAAELRGRGVWAEACGDATAVLARLVELTQAGDVVLVMSNGGFDNLHERLLAALRARQEPALHGARRA